MIPGIDSRENRMKRFVEGTDRNQSTLFPECLEDWINEENPVRVIDAFVDELDLGKLGFAGIDPEPTGRPSYHPATLLKLYIYGYLNRVQSSRRLESEAGRNVEVMWLLGRLAPDHKTIADFRKDNGASLRKLCARFVELCRAMGLLATASVAIDGSKFKAVNNRDKNFTRAKIERRRAQLEQSVARYLSQLDTADRQEPSEGLAVKVTRLKEKLTKLKEQMSKLAVYEKQPKPMTSNSKAEGRFGKQDFRYVAAKDVYICPAGESLAYSFTTQDKGLVLRRYRTHACQSCSIKRECTTGKERLISRWEHEHVIEAVQRRLDEHPEKMRQRRETVEHPFGTIKARMGATHFLMKTLPRVASEMALHVLAYNLTRVMNIVGIKPLIAAIQA
jgi:transposase